MLLFTDAANYTSRCADPVADLDRGLYMFGLIGLLVILNAYNVYLFADLEGVRITRI